MMQQIIAKDHNRYLRGTWFSPGVFERKLTDAIAVCKGTALAVYFMQQGEATLIVIYGPRPQVHVRERVERVLPRQLCDQKMIKSLKRELMN